MLSGDESRRDAREASEGKVKRREYVRGTHEAVCARPVMGD